MNNKTQHYVEFYLFYKYFIWYNLIRKKEYVLKITKGKVILVALIAYFTIFAFININKEKELNKKILKEVVYVTDGKVDSKNEGKLVLVSGKIEYDELVSFIELEDFGTIKINRKVEDYKKEYDDDDNEYVYEWVERETPLDGDDYLKKIVSEEKVSNINIGEFVLDKRGLELIPADSYYSDQESIGGLITTGIDYSRDPHEEDLKEGDMKITYKYYDLNKYPNMSILAVQKGNSFVPYQVDKKKDFYQVFTKVVDNEKDLEKELKSNVKKTTRGKFLFIAMILGVGVFFIVDSKKGKKN